MHLTQMFPSRHLSAEDLRAYNPGITVVTIEKIDFETERSARPGEPGIKYYLKLREFAKSFKLNRTSAAQIAGTLGTEDTSQWLGQTIGIFPIQLRIGDKLLWVVNVDAMRPTTAPQLPPNSDITGLAVSGAGGYGLPMTSRPSLPGAAEVAPMGMETAAQIVRTLQERKKTWDDLLAYLKDVGKADLAAGKSPPDCPVVIVEWARRFVRMFPKVVEGQPLERIKQMWAPPPPSPAVGEVVNPQTGEVISSPAVNMTAGLTGSSPAIHVEEDDIPF